MNFDRFTAWIIITWYLLIYFQRHFSLLCSHMYRMNIITCVLIVESKKSIIHDNVAYVRVCVFNFNLRTWEQNKNKTTTNGRYKNYILNQSSVNILEINAFNLNVFYMVKRPINNNIQNKTTCETLVFSTRKLKNSRIM